MDKQAVSVAGENRPPILHARAFTREGQERIALYARQGDDADFSYHYVNSYALEEWQSQERTLATSLSATLLPWDKKPHKVD